MATKEQSVEQVGEALRREAVGAIASAGTQKQTAIRNTGAGLARAGQSVLASQDRAASNYNVQGLDEALRSQITPALANNSVWTRENAAFEQRQTASQQTGAEDFFAGYQSSVPIVRSGADATRVAAEQQALRSILDQELQVGGQALSFRQAVEQRQAAREAAAFQRQQAEQQQAFQRQAQSENIALQRQALAFQEQEAARMAAALQQQQAPAATGQSGRTFGEAWRPRSRWGWR